MLKPSRAKRLSDLLSRAIGPAAAKQGFAQSEIVARWATIVGEDVAAHAVPQKLAVPRVAAGAHPPPATLTLRVEGPFALEIQYRTAEIVERVNAHLGWACVGTIKLRQGSTTGVLRGRRRPTPPAPTEDEAGRVDAATVSIEEPGLAEALGRLGRATLAKRRVTRD